MRFRITSPKSFPPYLKIEPTPLCQLRCPGCVQSKPEVKKQLNSGMFLSLEALRKIIDPISDYLFGVSLSLSGEPLLNRNIVNLIEYIHSKNIAVSFPTNLSIELNEENAEKVIRSGLDCLQVSLDGASKESYVKYRVGGDFDLVVKNVKLLSNTKKALGLKHPILVWKYIVFEHNRHEVNMVIELYKTIGFDDYEFIYDNRSSVSKNTRTEFNKNLYENRKTCFWLWNTMIIRWNGDILPCCSVRDSWNIGNALTTNITEIWQSIKYESIREGFIKKHYGQKMHPACKSCIGLVN
ncbi:MAG: radical SAM/SPASM domain-containing protein [Bacteroidota bacterium]